ncbi:hypothetical protein VB620_02610 [Nodularia harveyana UHCC-0300]|uniref:Uncharacterized protein n=1 Tax=Nodularia harveyana UHCC-0300 TaxID=2974287 RepID=A0ABU5UA26_9CYAN|nr:hypothetical protein [Nodularia harveyana]MEA5580228.1 hypothetical protein [Nodularia harveyana UHCC-0300]
MISSDAYGGKLRTFHYTIIFGDRLSIFISLISDRFLQFLKLTDKLPKTIKYQA